MLTRTGWLAAGGALVALVVGRLFGVQELFVIGTGGAGLVVLAALRVGLARLRLEVARELHPPRVHAGTPSRVELQVRNVGTRRTPVLHLQDPVTGTAGADLLLAPLRPGESARAAYRLPTERRGVLTVGPLDVVVTDPFGLAALATAAATATELTVYPKVDDIVAIPFTSGHDPHAGAEHPNALGRTGEDFYALRPYVVGDDLRRVHWPSTARRDELLVRQDELPWQGRVTVLLDVRRTTHTADSLELAVSAAASVVTASWNRRDLVRLVTTDGSDSGFGAGSAHVEAIMEHLATVPPTPAGTLRGVLDALSRSEGGGALVLIVAGAPAAEVPAVARLRRRFGSLTTVMFEPSSWGGRSSGHPLPAPATGNVVRVTGDRPFADTWNTVMRRRPTYRLTKPVTA
jgi:uncharacterized protein (DUF58 family)